jgi:hypothetical protein
VEAKYRFDVAAVKEPLLKPQLVLILSINDTQEPEDI